MTTRKKTIFKEDFAVKITKEKKRTSQITTGRNNKCQFKYCQRQKLFTKPEKIKIFQFLT